MARLGASRRNKQHVKQERVLTAGDMIRGSYQQTFKTGDELMCQLWHIPPATNADRGRDGSSNYTPRALLQSLGGLCVNKWAQDRPYRLPIAAWATCKESCKVLQRCN